MPIADDIRAAGTAGIITPEKAEELVTFLAERTAGEAATAPTTVPADAPDPDEETVRFVRGFQDVLLTIGIALLLVGIGVFGRTVVSDWVAELAAAAVSFALAVGFASRWRLVLPSMALAIGFTVFSAVAVAHYLDGSGGSLFRYGSGNPFDPLLVGALTAFLAAAIYYVSFRLPFALGLMAVTALGVVFAALHVGFGINDFRNIWAPILLIFGLATFAVAMAFDMSDPMRRTLRADGAFWLHLAAAPMIVHAVITMTVIHQRAAFTSADALIVIALVLAFALVALVIDRRALFVAALGYFGFAIAGLVRQANLDFGGGVAATLVLTGAAVLALGTSWHRLRRILIGRLPLTGLLSRLPPVGDSAA